MKRILTAAAATATAGIVAVSAAAPSFAGGISVM